MKKKLLMTLVAMAMLTVPLAACGSEDKPKEPEKTTTEQTETTKTTEGTTEEQPAADVTPEAGAKLVVWAAQEQKDYIEAMGKDFEAKYGIKVEYQKVSSADALNKIQKDGPAGVGADVFMLAHDQVNRAAQAGVVFPNDFYAEDTKANFVDTAVNAVTGTDGVLYGYPRNIETYLLFYNKNLVKPEDLATWDSIKAFSKAYNNPAEKKFGIMWKLDDSYFNYAFIGGSGGYVFGKNNTDPADIGLNNEGAVEGMKFMQSMKEVMPFKVADATSDVKTDLFQKGKLAIDLDGIWQLGSFTKEKLGFDVGAVPLPPMPNGKSPKPFAGVQSYFVSAFSQYPNAARLFAHYVSSQEAAVKMYQMTGVVSARKGLDADPAFQNDLVKAFMEQFKNVEPMPSIAETGSFWTAMGPVYPAIWDNNKDVKATLDKAVTDMKTLISQAK
ncbi:extracellular solute-binding protein family 1 [Paenibacillus curdlanolyticus YK9]|uniref:Extracellular solute-binding protein family 1 n=1 Tax=Paenibacillus curdlanolyticus YK9 TaxID=717606 RepID=E0I7S0_9BACL|nr:maltose ABC transporter substrate-binding protein [Paenibacillus curdlanolyticus]EFM11225.1 extracellular solute-binding protein family 1 [Paenibacillus curdlanolyticus YK9]